MPACGDTGSAPGPGEASPGGRLLFIPDSWDRMERSAVADCAGPGTVMVDVGADFDAYTGWLLHLLGPECRNLALEAEPGLNAVLVRG